MQIDVTINLELGLHARPCTRISQLVGDSGISIIKNGRKVSAKSTGLLLSLGAKQGETITIEYTDDSQQDIVNAITAIAQSPTD